MRYFLAIAAILLASPALGADKGSPATFEQLLAARAPGSSCYVETSLAGTFVKTDREAQGGIGGGCDAKLANLIIGAGIRGDFGDHTKTGSIFAKLGVAINNGATLYGLAEWRVPEWKLNDAGQLAIGGGGELNLSIINPALSLFSEATFAASKFGSATKDDVHTRIGLRWRF